MQHHRIRNYYEKGDSSCLMVIVCIVLAIGAFLTWLKEHAVLVAIVFLGLCSITLFVYCLIKKPKIHTKNQNEHYSIDNNNINKPY